MGFRLTGPSSLNRKRSNPLNPKPPTPETVASLQASLLASASRFAGFGVAGLGHMWFRDQHLGFRDV